MCGELRTSIVHIDRVALLTVSGDIDIATGEEFARALDEAISLPVRAVELDLDGVTHFGSEGIRRLLQARSDADIRSVRLTVAAISRQARQVLHITGLTGAIKLPKE